VAGCAELGSDPRFASNKARVANREVLVPLLRQTTVFKSTARWIELLEQAGVPCGPINNLQQVFEDPQVKARGLRLDLPHALGCLAPQVASPIRLSATPVEYRQAPPLLGQHTEQVLQSLLDMDQEQIGALRAAGVL
jgi:crotonobetainyl-CoA:carnitine CoA-transferase CaiB-like acyl-CoA transferase